MKTINDLKAGDAIYTYNRAKVQSYEYLCVYPRNKSYHILLNTFLEEPFRIYEKDLTKILEQNLNSYDAAALALAEHLQDRVNGLRESHNKN